MCISAGISKKSRVPSEEPDDMVAEWQGHLGKKVKMQGVKVSVKVSSCRRDELEFQPEILAQCFEKTQISCCGRSCVAGHFARLRKFSL